MVGNAPEDKLAAALAAHRGGHIDEAARLYQAVLANVPHQADALHMLGVIAQQKGNAPLALQLIEAALAQNPSLAAAWYNRGLVLRALNRATEALQSAEQAADLDPRNAEAWAMMGHIWRERRDPNRALVCYARAIALQPNHLEFQADHALALYDAGDIPGAHRVLQRVVKTEASASSLTSLANVLKGAGHPLRALPFLRQARDLMPTQPQPNEAAALLQIGDYAAGWSAWGQRPDLDVRFHALPLWQGQTVNHLLLHEDQGMGDAIQAARYIPMAAQKAQRITLQIAAPLREIFATTFPNIKVMGDDEPIPQADARARLMSLPSHFQTDLTTIPNKMPYLATDEARRKIWRERLAHLPHPRIGIVWGGNPANLTDQRRSLAVNEFRPILQTGATHLVSLQKGAHKNGVDLARFGVFDADPFLHNFADTAALMAELDLIITTCTSTAHLAGALGRPTWLMLCFDPHWLWLLEREDSPWYPTLRLFRQTHPRGWPDVVARVADALRGFLAGDKTLLAPPLWSGQTATQNPHALNLPEAE